jgi:hypothetical protein
MAVAQDARQGPSRLLLLSALERSAWPRGRAALMDLGTDPELEKEIRLSFIGSGAPRDEQGDIVAVLKSLLAF